MKLKLGNLFMMRNQAWLWKIKIKILIILKK